MSTARRLRLIGATIGLGCLTSMAISWPLWLSPEAQGVRRSFPMSPVVPWLSPLPWPLDAIHAAIFAANLMALIAAPSRRWVLISTVLIGASLVIFDQSRLQPWLYQYLMMLGVLACCHCWNRKPLPQNESRQAKPNVAPDEMMTLGTLRLIVLCIYAFSALHKVNATFINETARLMLRPIADITGKGVPVNDLGYFMPIVELTIPFLLIWPRKQRWGVILAIAMHVVILLLLGPLGINHNHTVWPWNLVMVAIVWLLFWPQSDVASEPSEGKPSHLPLWERRIVILFAAIVPIGGLFGWVDLYLSWAMYAGAPPLAGVRMSAAMIDRLPPHLREHVKPIGGDQSGINILDWALNDMRAVYPEVRVLRAAAIELGHFARDPDDFLFILIHRPERWTGERQREELTLTQLRDSR